MPQRSETAVTQDVLLRCSQLGIRLFRNNSGAVTTDDGRHIRFGLGNTSAKLNATLKSSDLIGITPVVITPEHIGRTVGVFTSLEIKNGLWRFRDTDKHAVAQERWCELIRSLGGYGGFVSDVSQLEEVLK